MLYPPHWAPLGIVFYDGTRVQLSIAAMH